MHPYFEKLRSNLELTPTLAATVSTRHKTLRDYLENHLPAFKSAQLIGSFQRQTKIHPVSGQKIDVDILVLMGEFTKWIPSGGISTSDALDAVHGVIYSSPRYRGMEPAQDPPTVSLSSSDDVQVELVPAYLDMVGYDPSGKQLGTPGRGYWVPKRGRWAMADYDYEAAYISTRNSASRGYLVPTIKMLKALKRRYFVGLESFPLEILATIVVPWAVESSGATAPPYPYLLRTFFEVAPILLQRPIQIPGSKSTAVILPPDTVRTLTEVFGTLARFIAATEQRASESEQAELWRELFLDAFPARLHP